MKLAYLINQYPQPSQSFIRREIRALEASGMPVRRFTVRRFTGALADPADQQEQAATTSVLEQGSLALLKDTLAVAFTSPRAFFKALGTTLRHGRRGDRGRLVQLVYLAEAATLRRMLREAEITHVHAHFGTNSTEVAMLCRLLGGPAYSFTVHGPEEFDRAGSLHLDDKLRHASFAVCISSYGRSQMWRWVDFTEWEKVQVVHCGVDEGFLPAGGPTQVPDSQEFVCVGRLVEQKGQMVLLEAARRLRDRGERFTVHLLGDGPLRPALEGYIDRHGLAQHVVLHGFASGEQVRWRIEQARATVLPSFAEGLPVAIMESLALGRPCVATYVAGTPELVVPGEHGWLVPAGDPEALAGAMAEVLATPPDRLCRMGRGGWERVRERHDVRTEAGKLRKLLEGSAGGNSRGMRSSVDVRGGRGYPQVGRHSQFRSESAGR